MNKIRSIKFINHPILKNLELNLCDKNNNSVNTIIIAGENGTGKSTILNCLYKIASYTVDFEADVEVEIDNNVSILYFRKEYSFGRNEYMVYDNRGLNKTYQSIEDFKSKYKFGGIFSDVAINFETKTINSVTSLTVDSEVISKYSDNSLPQTINQLFIDTQATDDKNISLEYRKAKILGEDTNNLVVEERMSRFTSAFNQIFDDLKYSRVDNCNGHKEILFNKNGVDISIDKLSSGEKQIVYRGAFLLKDVNALNGAFVFIDEPEISLHPLWQKNIMDYYKNIFTNKNGEQTSQIFFVTHSPFIIHNENRKNDKIVILSKYDNNEIKVIDKPEYYNCNNLAIIKDAFNINDFEEKINKNYSTIYLEGRTDEKYFKKAVEVFGYNNLPFEFKWVGYIDENGQECNTGKDSLNKAAQFLISQNFPIHNVCLFDCDTNREEIKINNVTTKAIPQFENLKKMKKGIENALILDNVDLTPYYSHKIIEGEYGEEKDIPEFDKMKCCDSICKMNNDILKEVFFNLKKEIEDLITLFNK